MKQKINSAFSQLITIATLTKLADLFISAKTTLAWLLTSLGAPGWTISLLVPIRESGSLIPQWPIKLKTQSVPNRVLLWRGGMVVQTFAIGLILLAALFTTSTTAGISVLGALLLLSLGRALCSLTMKDIQGLNVAEGKRGKLVGLASSISGLLSVLSAVMMIFAGEDKSQTSVLVLLGFSVAIMLLAITLSLGLKAELDPNEQKSAEIEGLFDAIRQQADLRNLIINRCLLLHGALIAPFFVSQSVSNEDNFLLPYFIIASALATFLSSYLWGNLADKSAVKTLFFASMVCVVAALSFYFVLHLGMWQLNIGLFFLLSLGYAGVRTGRKTYMLDIASGSQRTLYVASANTVVGYVLLALGGVYALLQIWLSAYVILIMTAAMLLGLVHTFKLSAEK